MKTRLKFLRPLSVMFFVVAFICCQKAVSTKDVVAIHATRLSVAADGTSLDTIYADLPDNSLYANRKVLFTAGAGVFSNGMDTLTGYAILTGISAHKVTAMVIWRASQTSGPVTLMASNVTIPVFTDSLYLTLTPADVDSIELTATPKTVQAAFDAQVSLTAILRNAQGGGVSLGGTIQFTDEDLSGAAAGGEFTPAIANVDSNQVTVLYHPGPVAAGAVTGDTITIRAHAYDINGKLTGRPGSTRILVKP